MCQSNVLIYSVYPLKDFTYKYFIDEEYSFLESIIDILVHLIFLSILSILSMIYLVSPIY